MAMNKSYGLITACKGPKARICIPGFHAKGGCDHQKSDERSDRFL